MNISHSKPVFTTLVAALALGAANLAGAADAGLSNNERAAQLAIVDSVSASIAAHETNAATLAQNEAAAQRVILVDYAQVSSPVTVGSDPVALVTNERAAQHAILDAPRAKRTLISVAATPVAAR